MRAGKLRHLVTIKRNTPTTAADGQEIDAMLPIDKVWAEVLAVVGGERVRGVQIEAGVDTLVSMRFRTGLDPTMQLIHDSRTLNIVRVTDPDGRRRELVVQCKEQVA